MVYYIYAQTFSVIKPLIIHFLAILHSLIQENTKTTVGVKNVTGLADAYSKEATSKGSIRILSVVPKKCRIHSNITIRTAKLSPTCTPCEIRKDSSETIWGNSQTT